MRNPETWLYSAEFDLCLTGIGCVWYMLTGVEISVGAASWAISSMGFGDGGKSVVDREEEIQRAFDRSSWLLCSIISGRLGRSC